MGPYKKALCRQVHAHLFVSAPYEPQKDFAVWQVDLDIQAALLADQVFFVYPDRRYQKSDARRLISMFTEYAGCPGGTRARAMRGLSQNNLIGASGGGPKTIRSTTRGLNLLSAKYIVLGTG